MSQKPSEKIELVIFAAFVLGLISGVVLTLGALSFAAGQNPPAQKREAR